MSFFCKLSMCVHASLMRMVWMDEKINNLLKEKGGEKRNLISWEKMSAYFPIL